MKKHLQKLGNKAGAALLIASAFALPVRSQTTTTTFNFTGAMQTFTVPALCGITMTIEARGAMGGVTSGPSGANGGAAKAVFTPTAGQVLNIFVGGAGTGTTGGFNGGGHGGQSSSSIGAGGGGASDVRIGGIALSNRVLVAGGGGGGGGSTSYAPTAGGGGAGSQFSGGAGYGGGGASGCATGSSGGDSGGTAGSYGSGGGGGGASSGGQGGGQPSASTGGYGCDGALGMGGEGGGTSYICGGATGGINGGGGGGGGYYGGGGGMTGTGGCNGGGGGGSSWINNSIFSSLSFTPSMQSGNGVVIITYTATGPGVVAAQSHTSVCSPNTVTLSASNVTTYTWTGLSSNNTSVTVNPSSNTIYTVQGTNSSGCISQQTLAVIANTAAPSLTVTSNTGSVCLGKTVTLTAAGALTYTWSNSVANGGTFVPTASAIYTVSASNACGISNTTVNIPVAPLPVTAASSSSVVCASNPATLTAVSTATTYTWAPVPLNVPVIIVNPSASTVYTVSASDGTCSGSATVALNVNPNPTLSIAASNSNICANSAVTLTVTGADTYSWSAGGYTTNIATFNPSTSTLYSATGTNSYNCSTTISQAIITKASPNLTATASQTISCSGDPVTLTALGNSTSWMWSTAGTTSVITVNPTQTTTYVVTGTAFSCTTTKTVVATVFIPTASVTGPTAVCSGNNFTLSATGADSYVWMPGNSPFSSSTFSQTASGVYTLVATATTTDFAITCTNNITYAVADLPNPTVNIVATSTNLCRGVESSSISATGAPTIMWTVNGATSTATGLTFTSNVIASHTITAMGTDANGCSSVNSVVIKVGACQGIGELSYDALQVYPVPAKDHITIVGETNMNLTMINAIGQVVQQISLNQENNRSVQLNNLPSGIYYLCSPDLKTAKKLIIE